MPELHSSASDNEQPDGVAIRISKPFSSPVLSQETPFSSWDTRAACIHMVPAFHYISRKLAQQNLHHVFIVTDYGQGIMPARSIPRSAQITFLKIISKASSIFQFGPSWMTALAEAYSKRSSKELFDTSRFDSYLIHRSLIQNEPIFLGEGLTLLSIDHIYTLKRSVTALSEMNRESLSRVVCLDSCIELLHEINTIYTGRKPRKGYFVRVYDYIPINEETLVEVMTKYDSKHGTSQCTIQAPLREEGVDGKDYEIVVPPAETKSPSLVSFPHILDHGPLPLSLPTLSPNVESEPSTPWDSILAEFFPPSTAVPYPRTRSTDRAICSQTPPLQSYPRNSCTGHDGLSEPHSEDEETITTILGSEWEAFRRIGLGVYTE